MSAAIRSALVDACPTLPRLSELDCERFGLRTARVERIESAGIDTCLEFCRSQAVRLLIARSDAADRITRRNLLAKGFELTEQRVLAAVSLTRQLPPEPPRDGTIAPLDPGQEPALAEAARLTFARYGGHYHADRRLDRDAATAVYVDWARRAARERGARSEVLVATRSGTIAAFGVVRIGPRGIGEAVLSGVLPAHRRSGLHLALLLARARWCRERGAEAMTIATHAGNRHALANWRRAGFVITGRELTWHRWLEPQ